MLEAAGDKDLWLVGGGGLAGDMRDAGLLDELQVTIVPVVLGSGKPLFERPVDEPMQLANAHAMDSGMVHLTYSLK